MSKALTWEYIKGRFEVDGSLRDVYIYDSDETLWNIFLKFTTSNYDFLIKYGDIEGKNSLSYTEIKSIQKNTPIMLKILIETMSINCHFFREDEIELDVDPKEINAGNYRDFMMFIKAIGLNLKRDIFVTDENANDSILLSYMYLEESFRLE